jgi:predicted nucleotidyltransferase
MKQEILQDRQKLYSYHQTALKHLKMTHEIRQQRWKKSLCLVENIAQLLRQKFDVSKIVLFGSILDVETFTQWSDIDIAVWGLEPSQTLLAIEEAQGLSSDIEINLVDINTAKPEVYQRILEKNQEI